MADEITCPNCGHEFALTDTLAAPLRAKFQADFDVRLAEETAAIEQAAKEAAAAVQADQLAALRESLAETEAREKVQAEKLAAAQKAQAEALRKERALAEREAALELAVEQKVSQGLQAERKRLADLAQVDLEKRRAEMEEGLSLKLVEKDQQMEGLKRQIELLKQKAEKGSQQLQGEAAEVQLEDRLAQAFPLDQIEPVGKGVRGADCLQRVEAAGAILWEVKRTQHWQPAWLPKLREDQRASAAEVAVIVSDARPEGAESFGLIDGVWVAAPGFAVPLAVVLRQGLLEVARAKTAREGQATKTEMIYDYFTGPTFRHRVEAIVERFTEMRDDLDRERKAMTRLWAKREKQIVGVIDATVGMYGDLQGIAGSAVQEIDGLELPMLEGDDGDD